MLFSKCVTLHFIKIDLHPPAFHPITGTSCNPLQSVLNSTEQLCLLFLYLKRNLLKYWTDLNGITYNLLEEKSDHLFPIFRF